MGQNGARAVDEVCWTHPVRECMPFSCLHAIELHLCRCVPPHLVLDHLVCMCVMLYDAFPSSASCLAALHQPRKQGPQFSDMFFV